MKRITLLAALGFVATLSYSQSDFREGFVITNTQDTTHGFIDYRVNAKALNTCSFKKSLDDTVVEYTPEDIAGYGFPGDKFVASKKVKRYDGKYESLFLEVIIKGVATLYKGEHYMLSKNDEELYPLVNEAISVEANGTTSVKNSNKHITVLNMLLFDCVDIRKEILAARVTEKNLSNLVERYNTCKGSPSTVFKINKPWITVRTGFSVGLNVSSLSMQSSDFDFRHLIGSYKKAASPVFGVSFDVLSPRLSDSWAFHVGLNYSGSEYKSVHQIDHYFGSTEVHDVTISLKRIKVPLGVRYFFPQKGKFVPYVNLGISAIAHVNSSSMWRNESTSNGSTTISENPALTIRSADLGLWTGLGMIRTLNDKLAAGFEVRYELSDGIVPDRPEYVFLTSKVTNLQFVLSFWTR